MVNKLSVFYAFVGIASATFAGLPRTSLERKLAKSTLPGTNIIKRDDTNPSLLYPAYNLSVPIDHFHNDTLYEPHTNGTFDLRYWFDATYYKPGGPVIVLQSGETSGVGRLGFLQKGLLHQLAVATHGIGVVLEHRYYGASIPTTDFSTENLRFLTTDQALADQAYWSKHIVFPGLEHHDLTAHSAAHIAYGGSYAGAFVAFLRKLYPDVYWGAISSSGVIAAIWDYWTYFEPIRWYGEPQCISNTQKVTNLLDNLLAQNDSATTTLLKTTFGLPNVTYDDDFMYVVAYGIESWQGKNWDPALNDPTFDIYCSNITSPSIIYPATEKLQPAVEELLKKGGYASDVSTLTIQILNWIGWLGDYAVNDCRGSQDDCFSTHKPAYYAQDDLEQDWRLWAYQYCTQWGYLQTGSGVPKNQLPLVSRLNTLEWNSIVCVEAFNITTPPDVEAINKYGSFDLSYPRLAMIDGDRDPWRPATAHASPFNSSACNRTDTISEPFVLIEGAVHHWDENGLFANQTVDNPPNLLPPLPVRVTQAKELQFVSAWLGEWRHHRLVRQP